MAHDSIGKRQPEVSLAFPHDGEPLNIFFMLERSLQALHDT